MEHEIFHPHRPREQRQMRGRRGRSPHKGDARTRREKHARRLACANPATALNKLIERGLNGDRCGGPLAAMVADLAERVDRELHPVLRRTLHALDRLDSPLLKSSSCSARLALPSPSTIAGSASRRIGSRTRRRGSTVS